VQGWGGFPAAVWVTRFSSAGVVEGGAAGGRGDVVSLGVLSFWLLLNPFLGELNQVPCPDFWARRRPRMAAHAERPLAVRPVFLSARLASGTRRAGPATAGMTNR